MRPLINIPATFSVRRTEGSVDLISEPSGRWVSTLDEAIFSELEQFGAIERYEASHQECKRREVYVRWMSPKQALETLRKRSQLFKD